MVTIGLNHQYGLRCSNLLQSTGDPHKVLLQSLMLYFCHMSLQLGGTAFTVMLGLHQGFIFTVFAARWLLAKGVKEGLMVRFLNICLSNKSCCGAACSFGNPQWISVVCIHKIR